MKQPGKKILILIVAILFLGSLAVWQFSRKQGTTTTYKTAELKRGELLISISATGTVEPEEVIDVGAQVAGRIVSFGKDANGKTVDYGSLVEAGTVLARIDDSLYAADVSQSEAQLLSSKAGMQRAQAELIQAKQNWQRAKQLGPSQALSQLNYDTYESTYKMAIAQVAVSDAAIRQAEATLARSRQNLSYCTITSPVKGIIIDRRVNSGQTVVASLNAPSLFLLAKDLTRIQVWVAVNEADIGRIQPGQPVSFTVDAFPGETFRGEVGKIRLNASMTQNVVTYTVEITTDNANGRLLPYLTANVLFHLQQLDNVLQVPNAALRWNPPASEANTEDTREKSSSSVKTSPDGKNHGFFWVLDENQSPHRVEIQTGTSNGINTMVEGTNLREGMQVITGMILPDFDKSKNEGTNPFTPKFSRGSKSSGGSK